MGENWKDNEIEHKLRCDNSIIGMNDTGFSVLWDIVDEHDFDKELAKIRREIKSGNSRAALDFEDKLERIRNDQTVRFEYSGHIMEPLQLGEKKDDLVVNSGLVEIAKMVVGQSTTSFQYFASGTGTDIERPSDLILASENFRVNMISSGFIAAIGTVMKFVGKFPSFIPSAFITEGGVFSLGTTNGGIMLFRTLLPVTSRIEHISGRTFYSIMQSINQVSVT